MKFILTFLFFLLFHFTYAQVALGKYYYIDEIIGNKNTYNQEYTLSKIGFKNQFYGNSIIFKNDGTFECKYSAPCGNDCFPSSKGHFEFTHHNYIKLIVEGFYQGGFCEEITLENQMKSENFYINLETEKIKLIKSVDNKKIDKENAINSKIIDDLMKNRNFKISDSLDYKTNLIENSKIVEEYLREKMNIVNYKVKYSQYKKGGYFLNLISKTEKDQFVIIYCPTCMKMNNVGHMKITRK